MSIVKNWAGNLFGTNTGKLHLVFDKVGDPAALEGTVSILDDHWGVARYAVKGSFLDQLVLHGTPEQAQDGTQLGDLSIKGKLQPDGNLRGEWSSTIGTSGVFVAFPHENNPDVKSNDGLPEQLFTRRVQLGAIRLFGDGLIEIAELLRRDLRKGKLVVTYIHKGIEVVKYFEDFLAVRTSLGELRRLRLHVQEPDAHNLNRFATIELTPNSNEVIVQGVDETWVTGKSETLASTMRQYQSFIWTNYKKFGLTLNQLIFLGMIVFAPEVSPLSYRIGFVVGIVAILQLLLMAHTRLIPNLVVRPSQETASLARRLMPSIVSWVFAVISAVSASYLYALLSGK